MKITRREEIITLDDISGINCSELEALTQGRFRDVDRSVIRTFHEPFNNKVMLDEIGLKKSFLAYVRTLAKYVNSDTSGDLDICKIFNQRTITRTFRVVPAALAQAIKDAEKGVKQITLSAAINFYDTHIKLRKEKSLSTSYELGYAKYVFSCIEEKDINSDYIVGVEAKWFEDQNYVRPLSSLWEGFA